MGGTMKKSDVILGGGTEHITLERFDWDEIEALILSQVGHTVIPKAADVLKAVKKAKEKKLKDPYIKVGKVDKHLIFRIKDKGLIDYEDDVVLVKNWTAQVEAFAELSKGISDFEERLAVTLRAIVKLEREADERSPSGQVLNDWKEQLDVVRVQIAKLRKTIQESKKSHDAKLSFEEILKSGPRTELQLNNLLDNLRQQIQQQLPTEDEHWEDVVEPRIMAEINALLSKELSTQVVLKAGNIRTLLTPIRQEYQRRFVPTEVKPSHRSLDRLDPITRYCVETARELAHEHALAAINQQQDNAWFKYEPIVEPTGGAEKEKDVTINPENIEEGDALELAFQKLARKLTNSKDDPNKFLKILMRNGESSFPYRRDIQAVFQKKLGAYAANIINLSGRKPPNPNDLELVGGHILTTMREELPVEAKVLCEAFEESYPKVIEKILQG